MSEQDIERFNDSLDRCTGQSGFLNRFYELFLASSKEVSEKFKHTNFQKQRRALKSSLYMMIYAAEGKPEGEVHLERIAKLHSRHELDIKPALYDLWLKCLIQAVKEFDPLFDAEVEKTWQSFMKQGIEFMKSRY